MINLHLKIAGGQEPMLCKSQRCTVLPQIRCASVASVRSLSLLAIFLVLVFTNPINKLE